MIKELEKIIETEKTVFEKAVKDVDRKHPYWCVCGDKVSAEHKKECIPYQITVLRRVNRLLERRECRYCKGSGKVRASSVDTCQYCKGTGYVSIWY